ncbi:MAG: hypothetical protein ABSG18_19705 [Steroidobacteraceae bacterium]|jgi:hypothetical protein
MYAKDRYEIDFATTAGTDIFSLDVQTERRRNRLIYLMVHRRYRT